MAETQPLGRIDLLDKGFVELLDSMGDDNRVVSAARVSLLGESKGEKSDKLLIKYLLENKHTSPFEHVEFEFRVKCPLFIRSQWHRHRMWSYNEVSRRYTDVGIEFYIPTELRLQAETNRQASKDETIREIRWNDGLHLSVKTEIELHSESCLRTYSNLLENGVSREQARMVLPQNMYTMFYAKTDLHNLLHFIELRNSEHAQYEMRLYAKALLELIKPIVPWTIEAWEEKQKNNR